MEPIEPNRTIVFDVGEKSISTPVAIIFCSHFEGLSTSQIVEKLEEVGHPKSETTIRRQIKSFDALRHNRNINEYTFICKDFFLVRLY